MLFVPPFLMASIFVPCCLTCSTLPPNHVVSHDGRAASTRAKPRARLPRWWEQALGPYPQLQWLQRGDPTQIHGWRLFKTNKKHAKDRLDMCSLILIPNWMSCFHFQNQTRYAFQLVQNVGSPEQAYWFFQQDPRFWRPPPQGTKKIQRDTTKSQIRVW